MSPSGKAPGFGPGISEVRVLPSQFLITLEKSRVIFLFVFCIDGREPQNDSFVLGSNGCKLPTSLRKISRVF